MEIAVEEMQKSRSEHRSKADPMVGAVVVGKDGEELGRAHRGALREGDHAEYTLIERMLGDTSLEDGSLYVTLEPCTSRSAKKSPCVDRIIKARLARVFVGIPDPNPNILGRGIQKLINNGVEVDFFDLDLVNVIRKDNEEFIKYYEEAEAEDAAWVPFEGPSDKEQEAVSGASTEDISLEAVEKYVEMRQEKINIPSDDMWTFLKKNQFLVEGAGGDLVPTIAGIVLFGEKPDDLLPQSKVMVEAEVGTQTITDEITGPLLDFRDQFDVFFKSHIRRFTEIQEFDRQKVYEYPLEALREAAFNAVVHRDYSGGARVHISVQRDRVTVRSPGLLLQPLSLSRVRAFNAPQYSRNPRIAVTLQHMTWIDEKGWGLGKMRDRLVERGLRPPLFDTDAGYFVVNLLGEEQAWRNVRVAPDYLRKLDEIPRRILGILMERDRLSTGDCAKTLGLDAATVRRHLGKLCDLQIAERRGGGSKVHYVLKGE